VFWVEESSEKLQNEGYFHRLFSNLLVMATDSSKKQQALAVHDQMIKAEELGEEIIGDKQQVTQKKSTFNMNPDHIA
jgi:hypothetical protein